jgi:hypothetical protein
MTWIEKLQQANEPAARRDPTWTGAVARVLPGGMTSISTVAVLDLLDMAVTTGNARRLAAAMRALAACRTWVRFTRVRSILRTFSGKVFLKASR